MNPVIRSQPYEVLIGGCLGDGVKYTLHGAFLFIYLRTFFSTRTGRTARQIAAPSYLKHVLPCNEVPVGGQLILDHLGAKLPTVGARDRKIQL